MPRLSLKPDRSFFRKLAIGAVGARNVCTNLDNHGHAMRELENGSTDTKIWKEVKRKRVRIPDLLCVNCGLRVESRAKTNRELSMSHSMEDAERAWDYGLVDTDVIAFPVVVSVSDEELLWSRWVLDGTESYWHNRNRVRWQAGEFVNYVRVSCFRRVPHAGSATKGVVEGSETSLRWDAILSSRDGVVETVKDGKIKVKRSEDGRPYTWQNRNGLPVIVREGQTVKCYQILASSVNPLVADELRCTGALDPDHVSSLLASPERTQRFSAIKLARLRSEPQHADRIEAMAFHEDEDFYVRLEAVVYLGRVAKKPIGPLIEPYLSSLEEQIQLEGVVALAEAATDEAVEILATILDRKNAALFLQSAAAWALGKIGTAEAIGKLINAFADVDTHIREEALEAVSVIGEEALDPLLESLVEGQPDVAAGAAEAIRRHSQIPDRTVRGIIEGIEVDSRCLWGVWLLGSIPHEKASVRTAIADLQDTRPDAHYAISVLWTFMESWIARNWEPFPTGRRLVNALPSDTF